MREFVVAGVQMAVKPNDISTNIDKASEWLRKAVEEYKVELLVFPETITTGFNPNLSKEELYSLIDSIPGKTTEKIQEKAREYKVHVIWPTYERGEQGIIYNTAVLIGPQGRIIGRYRKTHPFPIEREWTTPGNEVEVFETELGRIGMIICYDGDFPELSRVLALKGAEVIVRPSAFLRNFDIWSLTNQARAYDNQIYLIAINAIGSDAKGNHYFGHSMIVDPLARRITQASSGEEIISARLDPKVLKESIINHLKDRNIEAYRDILK